MSFGKSTEVPWDDTEKWDINKWYPGPQGFLERNNPEYIVDGYGIFALDPEGFPGDIYPLTSCSFTFKQALEVCEAHNNEPMLGFEKAKL